MAAICYNQQMSDTKTDIDELTASQPTASDPAYEKWKERKIARALASSKAHPEKRIPLHVIMKKFGLEH